MNQLRVEDYLIPVYVADRSANGKCWAKVDGRFCGSRSRHKYLTCKTHQDREYLARTCLIRSLSAAPAVSQEGDYEHV